MNDYDAAKVLRFTGKHQAPAEPAPAPKPAPRFGVMLALAAMTLATVAVNRFAYREGQPPATRAIASLHENLERDAAWEKSLAERLAQPGALHARAELGRKPNAVEHLRFGVLEDHYVITWRDGEVGRVIEGVRLNGATPVTVDADRLVSRFGTLFAREFATARPSSTSTNERSFELLDAAGAVNLRVTLAYDGEGRLLSIATK